MLSRLRPPYLFLALTHAALLAGTAAAYPLAPEAPGLRHPSAESGQPSGEAVSHQAVASDARLQPPAESVAPPTLPQRMGSTENRDLVRVDSADTGSGLRSLNAEGKTGRAAGANASPGLPAVDGGTGRPAAELLTAVDELQKTVVETLAEALDARVDRDGRVSFSLAGIEGFQFVSEAGKVAIGHGDAFLAVVQESEKPVGQRAALATAVDDRKANTMLTPLNPVAELLGLLGKAAQHPLLWLIVFFLVVGKAAFSFATRRNRQMRRTNASPPDSAPCKAVRVKVKRSRARRQSAAETERIDSSPPGLQES